MTLLEGRSAVGDLPALALEEYRAYVSQIPPPTDEQIQAFSSYVTRAKSWYKHLPLLPPGSPFHFYIDASAGLDRIVHGEGRATFLHRTVDSPKFHYTWMTTEDYRARFGLLTFASAAGTQLFLPIGVTLQDGRQIDGMLDNNPCRATVNLTEEKEFRIPEEVMRAGTASLTGVMHPTASEPWVWQVCMPRASPPLPWPEETGGPETATEIIARCKTIAAQAEASDSADVKRRMTETDQELERLLLPERQRLQAEIESAIRAMVGLVYDAGR